MLTVITPAASHALTSLEAIKTELEMTGTADDGWLRTAIDRASAIARRFCNRPFALETARETIRLSAPMDALSLARWPVVSVVSVIEGGKTLAPTDYETDADAGFVYRLTGSDQRRDWPTTKIVVEYAAGYVLPGDPARTLPEDIERAVILLVRSQWFARDRDPLVKAEEVSDVGRSEYWIGSPASGSTLPADVEALLAPYRQPALG